MRDSGAGGAPSGYCVKINASHPDAEKTGTILGLGRAPRQPESRARNLPEVRPRLAVEVLADAGLGVGRARAEQGHAGSGLRGWMPSRAGIIPRELESPRSK